MQLNELPVQIGIQKVQNFLGFYPELRGRGTQTLLTLGGEGGGAFQLPLCLVRER